MHETINNIVITGMFVAGGLFFTLAHIILDDADNSHKGCMLVFGSVILKACGLYAFAIALHMFIKG
jgi:hypothetical protein